MKKEVIRMVSKKSTKKRTPVRKQKGSTPDSSVNLLSSPCSIW